MFNIYKYIFLGISTFFDTYFIYFFLASCTTLWYSVNMKNITILELRKQTGMSQSQFAKKFHINLKTLQSWEQGWRNTPEHVLYMVQKILELSKDMTLSSDKEAKKTNRNK